MTTDRNSKNDAKTSINHDRVAANDDDNNPYSTIRDTADGQVFGKTRRTEGDEDGHKENDNDKKTKKEKEEEARAKRTHSSPPERPEPKGFSKKRFSSKGHSRSNIPPGNGKSVKKADKKKRKKKSQSDDELSPPTTPTSPSKLARDRRSFIGRELPQRPSEGDEVTPTFDNNYAEPFDRAEEDCNYETVENQVTLGAGVSSRKDVVRSHRGSSSSRRPATKRSDVEDDIFYDSVDEKKKSRNLGSIKGANIQSETFDDSDTYEIVKDPTKRRQSGLKQQDSLYECVDSRSVLADYEEPNLTRKRSASDIVTTSSTPVTVAERKSASLQREMTAAPPLPGRDNLTATHKKDDRSQGSDENAEELIEPYTLTRKSGDFILQETSTSLLLSSLKANPQPPNVSPEELEKMYAKVDKEKQIRDRLEMESKAKKKESEKDEVDGSVTEANAEGELSSKVGNLFKYFFFSVRCIRLSANIRPWFL